jgi:2-methylisocitrate lyase-like PEP mutase family enzyme/predicted thioesterase
MIRLMETAAFHALHPFCENDEISVGTAINVEHRAAIGVGAQIRAEAIVEAFDGRFYVVRVSARARTKHGELEIGHGTVGRAIVTVGKFLQKMNPSPATFQTDNQGSTSQRAKAEAFRAMHHGPKILILPNAWDVASARIFELAGVAAIATSSAGVAFTLGYPDGQKISREEMLAAVTRIAAKVSIPVTADVEAGYGNRPEDAARTAEAVIESGAVGLNLEDGTDDPAHPLTDLSLQLEKFAAIPETARHAGVLLVLNARTDVYLAEVGEPATRYAETVKRLSAFRDAGAACLFAPGLRDSATIGALVRDLQYPVNILAGPGSPPIPELQKLGVARVSLGSSPIRATLGLARRIAEELLTAGTYHSLEGAPPHAEVNQMLE